MSKTFKCQHCQNRFPKNPRVKDQKYCGSIACQGARKNKWERDKLKNDPEYKEKRRAQKKRWYLTYPGDKYQKAYREDHSPYVESNKDKQQVRNENRQIYQSVSKIVKTDTLNGESLTSGGIYVLFPYTRSLDEKIVKTDALIVKMLGTSGIDGYFLQKSG